MIGDPASPHDGYFKHVMSRPEDAAAELRTALPAQIVGILDLNYLEAQPTGYLTAGHDPRFTDVLYRTRLRSGRSAFIHCLCLIEHQSSNDESMALRIDEYAALIWRQHRRRHKTGRIPALIPLVVHNNPRGLRWSAPTDLGDLIDVDDTERAILGPLIPRMCYLVDDISAVDVDTLKARDLTPPVRILHIMQKIGPKNTRLISDMLDMLADDLATVLAQPDGPREFGAVIRYALLVGEASAIDLNLLADRLGARAKEVAMTTAEQLRLEGEDRGRASTLIELLTLKFGPLPDHIVTAVRAAGPERLQTWTARILTATTLDDLFTE